VWVVCSDRIRPGRGGGGGGGSRYPSTRFQVPGIQVTELRGPQL
jgi:hypothetical protein